MKREHFKRTAKIGFWALLLSAYSVGAAGVHAADALPL